MMCIDKNVCKIFYNNIYTYFAEHISMICVDASGNACYNLPFNVFVKGFVVAIANVSFFCYTQTLCLLPK